MVLEGSDPIETQTTLSLEEFSAKIPGTEVPIYNNFYLFFIKGAWHQQKPAFQRFQSEHAEFAAQLEQSITGAYNAKSGAIANEAVFKEALYKAYLLFKEYGYSDEELFS